MPRFRKILSVDAETNGLHGQPFAVGAVQSDGGPRAEVYLGRCEIDGPVDPWVQDNVLPALADVPITHQVYDDLLADFARWYDRRAAEDPIVLGHVVCPVEARLFADLVGRLGRDPFSGPFPLHDLASMLLVAGHDPTSADSYVAARGLDLGTGFAGLSPHNPLYDARVAEVAARDLLTPAE